MDSTISFITTNLNKPFKFEGLYFQRWKQMMMFFLVTKKLYSFCLTEELLFLKIQLLLKSRSLKNGMKMIFFAKIIFLNGLFDSLYDYNSNCVSAKMFGKPFRKHMIRKRHEQRNSLLVAIWNTKWQMTNFLKLNLMSCNKLLMK